MKRIFALIVSIVMVATLLAACGPTTTENPGLIILDAEPIGQDSYGIAVQQGQDLLLELIDNALTDMKADGTYDYIFYSWFSDDDPAPVLADWEVDPRAAELGFEELVMATNAAFPPFEFVDDDGNYAGFDVDIANEIADRLGLTLRIDNMSFDAIIVAVQTGPGNLVGIAAITIREDRAEMVNFTMPYFETELVVIVPADSEISSNDDLEGRNVAVQLGTTSDLFVSDSTRGRELFEENNITRMQNPPDLILELNSGRVDAVIIDREVALQFIQG